jgi:hypothetical protein
MFECVIPTRKIRTNVRDLLSVGESGDHIQGNPHVRAVLVAVSPRFTLASPFMRFAIHNLVECCPVDCTGY